MEQHVIFDGGSEMDELLILSNEATLRHKTLETKKETCLYQLVKRVASRCNVSENHHSPNA